MDLRQKAETLSEIEKRALAALDEKGLLSIEALSKESGLPVDSVRRAVQWLKEKGLISVSEKKREFFSLTAMGKASVNKALPERLFLEALQQLGGKSELEEVFKKSHLNRPEFNVAMGIAKKNAWISIMPGKETILELTGLEKQLFDGKYALENVLKKIGAKDSVDKNDDSLKEALKRGLAEKEIVEEYSVEINEDGRQALSLLGGVKQRTYDIQGAVPRIFIGKKQAYELFLERIRAKLVALGFKEMQSPLITQEFYNFDALFQPQGHPARQWTDTYQLKRPKFGRLPAKEIVARVKAAHENGWKTGSKGWRYSWSEEIAKKVMPAAHGTAHSARQLVLGPESPGKYFAIARCYRPDVVDASHLIEFNQMEGIIIGKELNFRHLLGMLEEFAVEIAGAKRIKFSTGYFPFTEPSCELYIEHPEMGWLEIGGAGIFRPELTMPLGVKEPVLAWGLGIDRLAMIKLGIKDIRQLFSQNLNWLRDRPIV